MKTICWLCYWRWKHDECVFQEVTPSEQDTEQPSENQSGGAPALLGKTKEFEVRPDEHNVVKELKVAAKEIEQAGMMTPKRAGKMKRMIAIEERRFGTDGHLDNTMNVPYMTPNDVRFGLKKRRHY